MKTVFYTIALLLTITVRTQAQCPVEVVPLGVGNGLKLNWTASSDRPSPTLDSVSFDATWYTGADQGPRSWKSNENSTFDVSGNHTLIYRRNSALEECYYTNGQQVSALPVELVSFTSAIQEGTTVLTWVTSQEINNERFEIEKSSNGTEWDVVGTQQGAGNTNATQTYTWKDDAQVQDIAYYRLKQIDYDGTFEYSPVVTVAQAASLTQKTQAYPNPFQNELTLVGQQSAKVYHISGQLVTEIYLNGQTQVNTSDWNDGIYIIDFGTHRERLVK